MEIRYKSAKSNHRRFGGITRREVEILSLIQKGNMNKQIASILNISVGTVKTHVKNIFFKTDSHNKIEALNKTKWLTSSMVADRN